jgi:hypothetical protein
MNETRETILLARRTARYLERDQLPLSEKILELWFAPKRFESTDFYERLGVRFLKRYVPTGGDFFIQRYGVRIVEVRGNLDAMIHFEGLTRIYEAIHTFFFISFVIFSLWRWLAHQTTFLDFLFAVLVYVLLILSPAALQRYNRIRAYRAIWILAVKKGLVEKENP